MKRFLISMMLMFVGLVSLVPITDVHADIAPPQMPPGANLDPGGKGTQVRMVAETVTLTIRQDPQDETGAIAKTSATFTMRNLGTSEESMQARFPLSFATGNSDGFGNFPEIDDISVKVNGRSVSTRREMQPAFQEAGATYLERTEVPWSVFNVTFPPGQDVTIDVAYTINGFGYYPYEAFRYILETGEGWNDTIGSADIIVRLPYDASQYNIWLPDDTTGYSQTSRGAVLSGNEVRWHFDNLEPTQENNIEITVVTPSLWQKVVKETAAVSKNPNDGEAWGRLGKAYKEIAVMPKGYPRSDRDGQQIMELSREAYEKCLALLPNDPLWHYGYAGLLWSHYYFDLYMAYQPDTENILPRLLNELKTSLELDPNNQRAKDLLAEISYSIPNVVEITDSGFDYLALTATPIPPTPYVFATETPIPSPTLEIVASSTAVESSPSPLPTSVPTQQTPRSPLCGGALILPLVVGVILWPKRRLI